MPKVKCLVPIRGAKVRHEVGDVVTVPKDVAEVWQEAGACELVKSKRSKEEKAEAPEAEEKAEAPAP